MSEAETSHVNRFHAGDSVPQPGEYICDGEGGACPHRFGGDVDGEAFPSLPEGCTGTGWVRQGVA
jgi:hypothetical protein